MGRGPGFEMNPRATGGHRGSFSDRQCLTNDLTGQGGESEMKTKIFGLFAVLAAMIAASGGRWS